MSLNKKHEKSVADAFRDHFLKQNSESDLPLCISLDGQDRHLSADYLIANNNKFGLLEFKYQECDLASERKKRHCADLCIALQGSSEQRDRHDRCHYVSWLAADGKISLNVYRAEICNRNFWEGSRYWKGKAEHLLEKVRQQSSTVTAKKFIYDFAKDAGHKGLSFREFDQYVKWLMNLSGSTGGSSVELVVADRNLETFGALRFPNLQEMYKWYRREREKQLEDRNKTSVPPRSPGGGLDL
jgi:hypothetical protein